LYEYNDEKKISHQRLGVGKEQSTMSWGIPKTDEKRAKNVKSRVPLFFLRFSKTARKKRKISFVKNGNKNGVKNELFRF